MRVASFVAMKGQRKLFHAPMKTKIATAERMGRDSGITICRNTRTRPAPSTRAASSSSIGIWSKNAFRMNTMAGCAIWGRITAQRVSTRLNDSIW